MKVLIISLFLFVHCEFSYQNENCDKLSAFKILAKGSNELKLLEVLKKDATSLSVKIERPAKRLNSSYIFTAPYCKQAEILGLLRQFEISDYEVFNPKVRNDQISIRRNNFAATSFDPDLVVKKYLSYEETNNYINEIVRRIQRTNPKVSASIKDEGMSVEHRIIKSVTVEYNGKPSNPIVFIDAGSHAREWHSRSMALYFLRKLVDEAMLDTNGIIYNTTFVIVPTVNPDGYEFSLKGDMMWRKTRKPVANNCIGVDINRNYDAHWNQGTHEVYPCSETYRGENPFSELETKIIRDIMHRIKGSCKMYIAIHTFGNTIIYPYGFTTKKHPRHMELHRVAKAGVDAVAAATGGIFTADQSGSSLYVAAGGSDDYAMEVVKIPFAYTFELGSENFGFAVPLEHLKRTLEEGFIALKAMVIKVLEM